MLGSSCYCGLNSVHTLVSLAASYPVDFQALPHVEATVFWGQVMRLLTKELQGAPMLVLSHWWLELESRICPGLCPPTGERKQVLQQNMGLLVGRDLSKALAAGPKCPTVGV